MEIRKVLALRGPNIWASFPVLEVTVDLGNLKDSPSNEIPGFNERLKSWLPSLIEHRCSIGERGGFFARLDRGTYLAHILEHVTLELQCLAGTDVGFGRARETSVDGVYRVAIRFREEELARACLATGLRLCLAAVHNLPFEITAEIEQLRTIKHNVCLGPSTAAIVNAARARNIPTRRLNTGSLVQLGYGAKQRRILTAETDRTGAIAQEIAQDKDLTRSLLRAVGVPTPYGYPVANSEEAWSSAESIGLPVVVKPQYGNQGRGVTTNLHTKEQVVAAYHAAAKESPYILVEKHAPGDDFRLLVVGDRLVAAARREPAQVVGDGKSTVQQLIDEVNRDPRRSEGHATVLSKIKIDAVAEAVLASQGYSAEAIPPAGAKVLIRLNANLSTGGTATDVTDLVHPEVAARAVDAAHAVGLDIAGVDVVAVDIGRPLEEQDGVIVEVNAGPGLRMHIEPSTGSSRPVGEAIVASLYPDGQEGRIPVVAITGTNGKTTTTRLIAHILRVSGQRVGMTCSDGIYFNGRLLERGDCSGPASAQAVLLNPKADAAVLEVARGGILRAGLGYDKATVAVVTNIGAGDHLGIGEINTPEQLAEVKQTVLENVLANGFGVLNAADPLTAGMASHCPGTVVFFALDPQHPVLVEHRAHNGRMVFVRDGQIVLAEGNREVNLIAVERVALTKGGRIAFQVENALAAVAATWSLQTPPEAIVAGLTTFTSDARETPGRFNVFTADGGTVIIDYAHNTSALKAMIDAIGHLPHEHRTIMYTAAGDRRDSDMIEQAEMLGNAFDHVILYEDACMRGRKAGEINALFQQGLAKGRRVSKVVELQGEYAAIEHALSHLRPGELIVIQPDHIADNIKFIESYLADFRARHDKHHTNGHQPFVEVREGPLGRSVYALRTVEAGQVVLRDWGINVPQRTRHSIQVDIDTHIVVDSDLQFINHSCEPNCVFVIKNDACVLEVKTLRRLEAGEELCTDYALFEYEIDFMPGNCLCGTPSCRGAITGYKDLPEEVRRKYRPYVAQYLREMEAMALQAD